MVSAAAAAVFFLRVLTAGEPIVDLRAFVDRNFAVGSVFSFVLGIGLYGLTYLYPIYLSQIRGHNALMIGETMFVSGVTMFFCAPIVGRLVTRLDPRVMLTAGFAIVALSNWQMSYITKDWDFWQLFVPQILRGFGMMLAIVPITNISLGTLPPDRLKNASGLFNLTRNLGGAVGLAALNTVFDKRIDLHLARLHDSITWNRPSVLEALNAFAARIPGSRCASHGAQGALRLHPHAGSRDGLRRRVPAAVAHVRRFWSPGVVHAPAGARRRSLRRALAWPEI